MINEFNVDSIRSAVVFGFKGREHGYNLEKVMDDFDSLMKVSDDEK